MQHEKKEYQYFLDQFMDITGLKPNLDDIYIYELNKLVSYISTYDIRPIEERRKEFIAILNKKFRLNSKHIAEVYKDAALKGFTFNYHQKNLIEYAFDINSKKLFKEILNERNVPEYLCNLLLKHFKPIAEKDTLKHLLEECNNPSKLRTDKGERDIRNEIIKAQFGAFMWVSLKPDVMHKYFNSSFCDGDYYESFWDQLHNKESHLFNRDNSLYIIRINQSILLKSHSIIDFKNSLFNFIADLYQLINNYGYLIFLIEPIISDRYNIEWELAADITLFAEKHREFPLKKAYFNWKRVQTETLKYIPYLDHSIAQFHLVNEGFTYHDCYVLSSSDNNSIDYLLLTFQKNERDDTLIPCPTCRSINVQGNSYSSLGVRSWECNNMFCPDRSKYNRGKRYSFRSLLMQQSINDDRNTIPRNNVRRWSRDVVNNVNEKEISEMLFRHYSLFGDNIHIFNWLNFDSNNLGRKIIHHQLDLEEPDNTLFDMAFFHRYAFSGLKNDGQYKKLGDDNFQVYVGDSAQVLRIFSSGIFDGAVTSPPYYNARDYAQWPNIYCYLHDMYDINNEVYRTLKPGALYFYNIFDYFDNENVVVFSDMGKKRIPLSSYTVDIFRRIGYNLIGNIVWDKGEIEGKRGYNAGNFSPYYQKPFNCWEHILIFQKPYSETNKEFNNLKVSRILNLKPVIKFINGENIHGHSAPFPDKIPELLIPYLKPGSIILDPFAGSLTTGRVAEQHKIRSVCIERLEEYCKLGFKIRENNRKNQSNIQLKLFE
jgi:DNA modification methylase